MAKKVVWAKGAQNDLIDILTFWIERNGNNEYSTKLFNEFKKFDSMISHFPHSGKKTNFKDVRAFVKGNFSLFYREQSKLIEILHVWDNRRNPEDLKL
ncbi:MAG: type II toxin-antitoxin system RelE/ParE family toxin [Ignavibacteria bacterium]